MKFGLDEEALQKIKAVFKKFPAVKEVILYGSRAKGTHRPSSDIDLAIKGDEIDLQLLNQIRSTLHDLNTPYTFDVLNFAHVENAELVEHIQRVGISFI